MQKAKIENAYTDTINSLNELVVSSDTLDVVAEEVKTAKVESVNGLTLAVQHPVLSQPPVKVKLFNDDVKNGDRNASSNITLANGDVVWVKVRNYHAAGVQTLEEATPRVKAKLIEKKAFDAAKKDIQAALDAFKTQPAATVLAKNQIRFENAGTFTRADGLLKREIERAAFSVPAPKQGMWSVTTASLPNELVVVAVSNVNDTTSNALTPEQLKELGFETPWPQEGDKHWIVSSGGNVFDSYWRDDELDRKYLAAGNVFPAMAAAQAELAKRKALQEIKTYIRGNFGEFEPNWDDGYQYKYSVCYDHEDKKFQSDWWSAAHHYSPFGYLASRDHAEQLIRDQEANLKILWGVK